MPHGLTTSLRDPALKAYKTKGVVKAGEGSGIAQGIKGLQQKSED